jgi:iron complex outermembrane receptor protein
VTGKQCNGSYLPFIPAQKLKLEIRMEREDLLFFRDAFVSLGTSTAFRQDNPAPDEEPASGYTLVDLGVGGHFQLGGQAVFIGLSAANLLDTKYIDHLSTLKEVNLYNPGRNIALSLRVPFGKSKT